MLKDYINSNALIDPNNHSVVLPHILINAASGHCATFSNASGYKKVDINYAVATALDLTLTIQRMTQARDNLISLIDEAVKLEKGDDHTG